MASYKYNASAPHRKPCSLQSRGLKASLVSEPLSPSWVTTCELVRADLSALRTFHANAGFGALMPVTAAPAIIVHEAQFIVPPNVALLHPSPIKANKYESGRVLYPCLIM